MLLFTSLCCNFPFFGGYMKKNLGRAIVVLFTSALCFGFASCNFGDGDNNSTSDNPSQKKYGVVESFSSNNVYYLAGERIKSTEYAISFYSNDGESCTGTSLTHSDKLEIQIGKDLNNLRPVVLGETAYETTDKIVLVKVKDSKSQDAGKSCEISVIPLTDINSISCATISIFQNTESIDNKIKLKKDTESITNITIFDGFTVKDGFTVWIDNNYGTDKAAETHDYKEYSSGSDLTDVIREMKENAKNDDNLGKKSHYYSYYVKYNEIISNQNKSICVNNQNL